MATAEPAVRPPDRHSRRRPFAQWMKRLANLKNGNSSDPSTSKKASGQSQKSKKSGTLKNNPYPESGRFQNDGAAESGNGHLSFSTPISRTDGSFTSTIDDEETTHAPAKSTRSTAPTVATNAETIQSDAGQSRAGTTNTMGGGGGNSTFSSPNHSERSLTTTLTTIQSTAASAMLGQQAPGAGPANQAFQPASVQFSHQYPISPVASAVPSHLAPHGAHPHTYQAATANGMLTDNASILTLASSSKRRRRNSLDTNASVRALAPSSVWGGSRESLPLSVLSSNLEGGGGPSIVTSRPSLGGLASAERASVYSNGGGVTAPALSSERNSYYAAAKQAEGGSVRSGKLGHGKSESISGSIGYSRPVAESPLTSPREANAPSRISRRSTEWVEEVEGEGSGEEEEIQEGGSVKEAGGMDRPEHERKEDGLVVG